jgi:hypothetical protein
VSCELAHVATRVGLVFNDVFAFETVDAVSTVETLLLRCPSVLGLVRESRLNLFILRCGNAKGKVWGLKMATGRHQRDDLSDSVQGPKYKAAGVMQTETASPTRDIRFKSPASYSFS